ncbi:MAG: hypothetical protein OEY38_24055 [Gammaproteobacteria bacterium]|nr:hypothetical protein [Gammaproteobacteria bacterium]
MLRILFCVLLLVTIVLGEVQASSDRSRYFIGITPSVTAEPFYNKGEFDVNVLPLVYQQTLFNKTDFRLTSIVNYSVRDTENQLSHIGFEAAFPMRVFRRERLLHQKDGFYFAPIMSIAHEQIKKENHIGFWLEPGYQFLFKHNYSMSIGLQAGVTLIADEVQNHFGINFIFGRWF